MNLPPRLKLIASKIPECETACDVGTDHAYIPIYLIENNICKKVIATDLRKGPLAIAKRHINAKKISERITTRLGNGLMPIKPGEVDTVIIAGMGGELLTQILSEGIDVIRSAQTLVIQPMNSIHMVRQFLHHNGFYIIDEGLTQETDKIYNVIVARKGNENYEDTIYYYIGRRLLENNDILLPELLKKRIHDIDKILTSVTGQTSVAAKSREQECSGLKHKYIDMLEKLEECRD